MRVTGSVEIRVRAATYETKILLQLDVCTNAVELGDQPEEGKPKTEDDGSG